MKDFHVTIIGGGVGGASLAVGLQQQGIAFDVYEKAERFAEIGAGLGIGRNAREALAKLGLRPELDRLATNTKDGLYFRHRLGDTEEFVADTPDRPLGNTSVHRAHLLEAIAAKIPKDRFHFNKQLSSISDQAHSGRKLLVFSDGTQITTDVVVGCDGIHSQIRRDFIDTEGKTKLMWSSTWAYRGLIPMAKFREALGNGEKAEEYSMTPQFFLAKDAHVIIFPIQRWEIVNVVAFRTDRSTHPRPRKVPDGTPWTVQTTLDELLGDFSHFSEDLHKILRCFGEKPMKWALHTMSPPLPSYVRGRIVVAGDAAHGGTPHYGALAGQAIEDALYYSRILGHPRVNASNVHLALQTIDAVRLPRANAVMEKSLDAGELYQFADAEMGNDTAKLGPHLETAWNWIWEHDHDEEYARGAAMFEALLKDQRRREAYSPEASPARVTNRSHEISV